MNMKKLTNVVALEMVLAMVEVQSNQELVSKLETMKAQFEKKANRSTDGVKKLTATQVENRVLADKLYEMLHDEPQLQSDLQKELEVETSQKMTAIVKIVMETNNVVKDKLKGKVVLSLKA